MALLQNPGLSWFISHCRCVAATFPLVAILFIIVPTFFMACAEGGTRTRQGGRTGPTAVAGGAAPAPRPVAVGD